MSAPDEATGSRGEVEAVAAIVAKTLLDEGCQPGSSIHSWRCEHPDRYGECTCVAEVAEEVAAALAPVLAEVRAEALREAADDYTNSVGATKARPHARQWLRDRANRIGGAS